MKRVSRLVFALLMSGLIVVVGGCEMDDLTSNVGAVQGRVTDEQGNPLVSAMVSIADSPYSALSNVDGRYVLNLPAGSYSLSAQREGFEEGSKRVELSKDEQDPVIADFRLNKSSNAGPCLYLNLVASDDEYRSGEALEMKLEVVNRGDRAVKLGNQDEPPWEITAHSNEGWIVWSTSSGNKESIEIAPGESRSFSARWRWFEHPVHRSTVVMLEGHVNPDFPIIEPIEIGYDGKWDPSNTKSCKKQEDDSLRPHEPRLIPGYVTKPLFVRLSPEGYARPEESGEGETFPGYSGGEDIEPWVHYGNEASSNVKIRPHCWRISENRGFYHHR